VHQEIIVYGSGDFTTYAETRMHDYPGHQLVSIACEDVVVGPREWILHSG
jgi:hypothetical protein